MHATSTHDEYEDRRSLRHDRHHPLTPPRPRSAAAPVASQGPSPRTPVADTGAPFRTRSHTMRIGILGTGNIGKTLTRRLSAAGHEVKAANSRGPETIEADVLASGGRAVTTAEAVVDVDAVILSIPFDRIPQVAPLIAEVPADTVVIDTSNYFPHRDNGIAALEAGQVESVWAAEQLGRPIAKAWNSIGAESFAHRNKPAGSADRISLPVAADSPRERELAMALVEDTGFDAFDAGPLAESWRQQPGTPAYCTDLTRQELADALATADAARSPKLRDLGLAVVQERFGAGVQPDAEYLVRLNRAISM
ncbi:NADPH-dependent F420 reductase [Streptomyces sp. NPDC058642]|uniref:NADPH-dependent F420 reductase n=1 Tax=Streptomyces sp. NPDC058642 TaxID=3346572 RepID=UPI0036582F79